MTLRTCTEKNRQTKAMTDRRAFLRKPFTAPLTFLSAALLLTWLPFSASSREDHRRLEHLGSSVLDKDLEGVLQPALHLNRANRYLESGFFRLAAAEFAATSGTAVERGRLFSDYGRALIASGRYQEAASVFENQAARGFKPGEAFFNAALALAHAGLADRATAQLDRAIRSGFLGQAELVKNRETFKDLADFDGMIARCEQGKAFALAIEAYLLGERWTRAVKACHDLLQVTPESGFAYQRLGFALSRSGEFAEAAEAFHMQARLAFQTDAAYFSLASVYSQMGKGAIAADFLRRAVREGFSDFRSIMQDPSLANARASSAFAEFQKTYHSHYLKDWADVQWACGDYAALVDAFWSAADQAPLPDWAARYLGRSLLELGHAEAALEVFRGQLLQGDQRDNAALLYLMARAHARLGQVDAAFACLFRSIDLGGQSEGAIKKEHDFRSLRCHARFEELLAHAMDQTILTAYNVVDWEHLRERSRMRLIAVPGDGEALHRQGLALLRLKSFDDAIEVFKSQIQTGHNAVVARYNIACCYALKGDSQRALLWLERTIETGWKRLEAMRNDPDLKSLRHDPRFTALVQKSGSTGYHDSSDLGT